MTGSKRFGVQNDFGRDKFFLGPKKFEVLWFKKFASKRNYHLKKLLRDFYSKQFLAKFWVQKDLGPNNASKRIWSKINRSKKIFSKKNDDSVKVAPAYCHSLPDGLTKCFVTVCTVYKV